MQSAARETPTDDGAADRVGTSDGADGAAGAERLVGSDRVLAVLLELAKHPEGIALDELAGLVSSHKPTVHRALASLRRSGLAEQDGHGHYVLGDEFLRIAFTHHEARPDEVRIRPVLDELSVLFGETVHYAVLDGRSVVYRSKVDPPAGAVKLSSTIGGRNPAHATAVGKLLLSFLLADDADVRAWVGDTALDRRTDNTITTAAGLAAELRQIRAQGYSVDDQENEVGINCVAVPAYLTSRVTPSGAISVSGLTYRTPLQKLVDGVPLILLTLGRSWTGHPSTGRPPVGDPATAHPLVGHPPKGSR